MNLEKNNNLETVDKKTGEITAISTNMERWMVMRQQAEALVKSGLLPSTINTPEKAIAVMQKGKELGIGYMEALGSINVIQGKPTCSAQLMLALARRTGELEDIKIDTNDKEATVTVTRKGQSPFTSKWGEKEATGLGLMVRDQYKKQPATMFKWRAISDNLRVTFGDALSGLYSSEEMDIETTTTTKGQVQMPKPLEIEAEVTK